MKTIIAISRLLFIAINPAAAVMDYNAGNYIICMFLAFATGLLLTMAIIHEINHANGTKGSGV